MKSLALAQLAPGPLAAQLAIGLGYVHSRVRGATLVSLAFIVPSFVMTVAIGWLYVRFGGLSWMQAALYGVGATVIGIIAIAAYKLARLTMAKDRVQWVIFAVMATVTAWTESESVTLFVLSGLVAMVALAPPPGSNDRRPRAWRWRSRPSSSRRSRGSSPRPGRSCSAAVWRSCRSSTAASCGNTAGSATSSSSMPSRSPCDSRPHRHHRRLHRLPGGGVSRRRGRRGRGLPRPSTCSWSSPFPGSIASAPIHA
jgi:chromate transport protein ChrA